MTEFEVIQKVNKLTKLDKLLIYMEYCRIPQIVKNYDFHIALKNDTNQDYWLNGYSGSVENIKKGYGNIKSRIKENIAVFYYNNNENHAVSFESYINQDNVKLTDNGDNWDKNGFAQRMFLHLSGIYALCYRRQELLN